MLVADLDFLSFFESGAAAVADACFLVEERISLSLEEVLGFDA